MSNLRKFFWELLNINRKHLEFCPELRPFPHTEDCVWLGIELYVSLKQQKRVYRNQTYTYLVINHVVDLSKKVQICKYFKFENVIKNAKHLISHILAILQGHLFILS